MENLDDVVKTIYSFLTGCLPCEVVVDRQIQDLKVVKNIVQKHLDQETDNIKTQLAESKAREEKLKVLVSQHISRQVLEKAKEEFENSVRSTLNGHFSFYDDTTVTEMAACELWRLVEEINTK